MRWDESVFSFTCEQSEGDPANLTVVVRRPRNVSGDPIGLLGPGRKIWCWFALDCGPSLFKFRGRLVGVPTSIFEELVTLEFVARPFDVVAQKQALAETLRVLPFYDELVIEPERRNDPEVVLEGYSARSGITTARRICSSVSRTRSSARMAWLNSTAPLKAARFYTTGLD